MKWRSTLIPAQSFALIALLIVSTLGLPGSFGCKSKKTDEQAASSKVHEVPADVVGLQAMPADVRAIVGLNIGSLRRSWLVQRMVEQMFRRDPELKQRIDGLIAACHIDMATGLSQVLIGLTPATGVAESQPSKTESKPESEALMVVSGKFSEAELASCIGQSVAADGRSLVADKIDGRTLYGVKRDRAQAPSASQASEQVWFAVSGPDTLVVATSKEFLRRGLSSGPKVASEPSMAALIARADTETSVWVAGEMDPAIGAGLVERSAGTIAAAPRAMFGSVDMISGMNFQLGVEMTSAKDANALKSLISGQKGLWALAAQRFGLGEWIDKLGVDADDRTVYLRVSLTQDEVRQILARVDTSAGSAQNPSDNTPGEP